MQEPDTPRFEVSRFPKGRRIALITSFGDGHVFDRRIVEVFNEWGPKAPFNPNSGLLARPGFATLDHGFPRLEASEVADHFRGHEVAREIRDDQVALEDLVRYPVRGFAYPFGVTSPQARALLKGLQFAYAWTVSVNDSRCFSEDPMDCATTCAQFSTQPTPAQRVQRALDDENSKGVLHIWGHGFEFEQRRDWDAPERIYRPLAGDDEVWDCANFELFDFEAAKHQVILASSRRMISNPTRVTVSLRVDGTLIDLHGGEQLERALPYASSS